jgi:flagellar motility protein MotE (MotC chaperone)
MRPRILPVLIAVSLLTLGVRVGEIWQGFGGPAEAQSEAAAAAEFVGEPFSQVQVAAAGSSGEEVDDGNGSDGGQEPARSDNGMGEGNSGPTVAAVDASDDPLSMSNEEIELLQQLGERRQRLNAREEALNERESLIKAAEKRLEDKIADLEALKSTIEDLLVKYDEQEDKQLTRLVNIYEKMKADDAARIFEDLEMPILLKVVDRMNERKTAPILAEMESAKAQALTLKLAERRDLPIPRE